MSFMFEPDSEDDGVQEIPYTLMVDFHQTEQSYSLFEDINCQFSFKDNFKVDDLSECFVCILKVGWENSQDALLMIRIDEASIFNVDSEERIFEKGHVYTLCFPYIQLPHPEREYYQFCFFWQNSVLGASQPFQIVEGDSSEADASDIEIVKEGDLEWWYETSGEPRRRTGLNVGVFLPNEKNVLEDTLENVMEENKILKEAKKEALNEIDALKEQLGDTENQKLVLEKAILEKSQQISAHAEHFVESEAVAKRLEELNSTLMEENKQSRSTIQCLQKQVKDLEKEKESLLVRMEEENGEEKSRIIRMYDLKLVNMKELFRELEKELSYEKDQKDLVVENFESQKKDFERQVEELYNKIKCIEGQLLDVSLEKEDLISKVLEKKESHLSSLQEKDAEIEGLVQQIKDMERCMRATRADHCEEVKMLKKELSKAYSEIEVKSKRTEILEEEVLLLQQGSAAMKSLIAEVEDAKSNEMALKKKLETLNKELDMYAEKVHELRKECDNSRGHYHALKIAYAHIEQKSAALRDERDDGMRKLQSLRKQLGGTPSSVIIEEQNKQIEELKLRLCMGSNAYREKFLEMRKYEREVKKLRNLVGQGTGLGKGGKKTCSDSAPDVADVHPLQEPSSKDKIELLHREKADLKRVVEEKDLEIKILKEQLEETVAALKSAQLHINGSGDKIRQSDSLLKEERQQAAQEIKRLEDLIHAKDGEIRNLRGKVESQSGEQKVSAEWLTRMEELKSTHERKVQKLQQECEKHKKMLLGVNQVILGKRGITSSSSKGQDSIDKRNSELESSSSSYIKQDDVESRLLLKEPHMEPIRLTTRQVHEPLSGHTSSTQVVYPGIYLQKESERPGVSYVDGSRRAEKDLKRNDNYSIPDQTVNRRCRNEKRTDIQCSDRVTRCPVCHDAFPIDISDWQATEHVNKHFES